MMVQERAQWQVQRLRLALARRRLRLAGAPSPTPQLKGVHASPMQGVVGAMGARQRPVSALIPRRGLRQRRLQSQHLAVCKTGGSRLKHCACAKTSSCCVFSRRSSTVSNSVSK